MKRKTTCLALPALILLAGCGDEVAERSATTSAPLGDPIRGEPIVVVQEEVDHWAAVASEIGELNASVYRSLSGGFNAVLGARGSRMQLISSSLLHLDVSPGNLSWAEYETIRDARGVREAYPIAVGDNYKGYRLVGSVSEMFEKHEWKKGEKYEIREGGRLFEDAAKEALLGAFAASQLGLEVGDKFHPYHGLAFREDSKHEDVFDVVGVLEATGTPADKVIWIPVKGLQRMDGHDPKSANDVSAVLLNLEGAAAFQLNMNYNQRGKTTTLAWPVETILKDFFQSHLPANIQLVRLLGEGDYVANLNQGVPPARDPSGEDDNATVVEGEITSVGGKIISTTSSSGDKEIVDLPPPPGSDGNVSVGIPPVVSNLPPLPEGSGYAPISFANLSKFPYEVEWEKHGGKKFDPVEFARRVPVNVRQLDGRASAVEGFMIPTIVNEDNKVTEFLLLPDQMSCCFGKAPEANGWVVVTAPKGVEILMDQIIRVTGTMSVEEKWDEEFFVGLYHMACDKITGPAL